MSSEHFDRVLSAFQTEEGYIGNLIDTFLEMETSLALLERVTGKIVVYNKEIEGLAFYNTLDAFMTERWRRWYEDRRLSIHEKYIFSPQTDADISAALARH
jgi:starvation-inducible outer membrane lipoprotein